MPRAYGRDESQIKAFLTAENNECDGKRGKEKYFVFFVCLVGWFLVLSAKKKKKTLFFPSPRKSCLFRSLQINGVFESRAS